MKILHISYSDTKGGAAIAMMRLHKSLINQNIDSKVLVAEKISNDPNVIGPNKSLEIVIGDLKKILIRQKKFLFKNLEPYSHSVNFFRSNILKKINEINPDIVNLHWVNNELLSIGQIGDINQPLVWTFLDMWPMCGGEHYTETSRYKDGYTKSNAGQITKGIDLNRILWLKKKKLWNNKIKNIVCISDWLRDKANKSILFNGSNVHKINCEIDLDVWKPVDKNIARGILNLPLEKKIFLFISNNGVNDERKGFKFVDNSLLKIFSKRRDFQLLLVGNSKNIEKKAYDHKIIDNVFDGNSTNLRLIYSACDLVLAPSTLEAFGQVALEGSCCGVPTVAFKGTGISDIIEHKVNGYLSNYLDQDDFTNGIEWIINNTDYREISNNCIKLVNEKYSNNKNSKKYIELYNSILKS